MQLTHGRRVLAGLGAAVAACAFMTPAYAAATPKITMVSPDVTVAAGGNVPLSQYLYADVEDETELFDVITTYELSGDLGGVTLSNIPDSSGCTPDGPAKLTCSEVIMFVGPDGQITAPDAQINATAAALGKTGKLTITLTADGIEPVVATAPVTVAEAVDLAAGPARTISAKPGASFKAAVQVHNTTDTVVHGAALTFGTDYAFGNPKQFANCFYADGFLNTCVFDQDLQPGVTYQAVIGYTLGKDAMAPGNAYGEFGWMAKGDYDDLLKFVHDAGDDGPGKPGTGPKLKLEPLPAARALNKQTDIDTSNNWQALDVRVTGKSGADIQAVPVSATGKAGDIVTAKVAVRNNGPATVDASRGGSAATMVVVTPPDGTEVAELPEACMSAREILSTPKGKGKDQYACFTDTVFPASTTAEWTFKLRITKVIDNATGWIEANPECACDHFSSDADKANDVAKIVINPLAGSDSDSDGAGAGAGAGNGTGGQGGGGGLPITGPQTALVGGAGAILIAIGSAGFLTARRRRTRFEA
ncbi:hypothetical protein ACQP2F_32070 [Actinoplanes sp. CA-030573]|uniref:hypothetical protein n=1 Tax=Actinoplanes sp. CA-030573 TaxID=3239898 RepID=UPI003D8EC186